MNTHNISESGILQLIISMDSFAPYDSQTVSSLRGIVLSRWFLICIFVILGVIEQLSSVARPSWVSGLWIVGVGAAVAYNSYFQFRLRKQLTPIVVRGLCVAQVVADSAVFTLIVYLTGGIESIAFLLYVFSILIATILFADIYVIVTACSVTAAYIAVVLLDFFHVLPHIYRYSFETKLSGNVEVLLGNTIAISTLLLFTGFFAVYINRLIQERTAQLLIERDTVRSLFQSLEDGIFLVNQDRAVTLSNPRAREILHIVSDEPVVLDLHRYPATHVPLLTILRDQTPHKKLNQEIAIDATHAKLHLRVDSIPVRSGSGEIVYWLKVMRDTTRERHIEDVKSDFISIAAHQLRTPLAALKWCFKILMDGDAGAISEQQRVLLNKAYERNQEVIDTVNNLLNVSEIEEGRLNYVFTRTNAAKIIQEIVEDANADAERRKVQVNFSQSEESLPFIDIDTLKFRIAIENIVDNAVKYSPENAVVDVRVGIQDKQYVIEVEDHGIGIPKEEQGRIFVKFFRGGQAKEKDTVGSGLGMYIVKNIIVNHRGTIRFSSEQGKGTLFTITLPISKKAKSKKTPA